MNVELRPVDKDNFDEIVRMPRQDHVAENVRSLAQAWLYPTLRPRAIYADGKLAGFCMSGVNDDADDPADRGVPWIVRMYVLPDLHGRGIGSAAVRLLVAEIRRDYPKAARVRLSTHPENAHAIDVYLKAGFRDTGILEDGEEIFELAL